MSVIWAIGMLVVGMALAGAAWYVTYVGAKDVYREKRTSCDGPEAVYQELYDMAETFGCFLVTSMIFVGIVLVMMGFGGIIGAISTVAEIPDIRDQCLHFQPCWEGDPREAKL